MILRPPRATRPDPLLPHATLYRSDPHRPAHAAAPMALTPIMQTPITQTQARTSTPPPRQPLGDQFRMRPGLMPWTRSYAPESGKRRSEEHPSELQSLMRISYADFCLKKKNTNSRQINQIQCD